MASITVSEIAPQVKVRQGDPTVLVQIADMGPQGAAGSGVPAGGEQYAVLQQAGSGTSIPQWTSDLRMINSMAFDVAAGVTPEVGKLSWNAADGTLNLGLNGGNVVLQVGQESVQIVSSFYGTGLVNGSVVTAAGSNGSNLLVKYAQANSESLSSRTLGIMTEDATGSNPAYCTTFGLVRDLNTAALTAGGVAWLSPTVPGGLTSTRPAAPNHTVYVGLCVVSHATQGVIFVNVSNGNELDELHDVAISTPTEAQALTWNGSLWVNKNIPIMETFTYAGMLEPYVGVSRFPVVRNGTLTHIRANVGTASVGSDIVVGVNANGVQVTTITITAGQHSGAANISTAVNMDDYITVDIVSIGSTTAGSDLTVFVTIE